MAYRFKPSHFEPCLQSTSIDTFYFVPFLRYFTFFRVWPWEVILCHIFYTIRKPTHDLVVILRGFWENWEGINFFCLSISMERNQSPVKSGSDMILELNLQYHFVTFHYRLRNIHTFNRFTISEDWKHNFKHSLCAPRKCTTGMERDDVYGQWLTLLWRELIIVRNV